MKESLLQKQILEYLKLHDVFHWRLPLGPILHSRGRGPNVKTFYRKNHLAGMPDIGGILRRRDRGRAFFIEVKTEEGKLSPQQVSWLVDLQAAGAACTVARSLNDVRRALVDWGEIVSRTV